MPHVLRRHREQLQALSPDSLTPDSLTTTTAKALSPDSLKPDSLTTTTAKPSPVGEASLMSALVLDVVIINMIPKLARNGRCSHVYTLSLIQASFFMFFICTVVN